jgi:hypothetical protein
MKRTVSLLLSLVALLSASQPADARAYAAHRGRFWTADTAEGSPEEPASAHRYTYAQNAPADWADPTGHSVDDPSGMTTGAEDAMIEASSAVPGIGYKRQFAKIAALASANAAALYWARSMQYTELAADLQVYSASLLQQAYFLWRFSQAQTVTANQARGDKFRDDVATMMEQQGYVVRKEVNRWTPFGYRRVDIEVYQTESDAIRQINPIGRIETKTGRARYSSSQEAKDNWLQHIDGLPPVNVIWG